MVSGNPLQTRKCNKAQKGLSHVLRFESGSTSSFLQRPFLHFFTASLLIVGNIEVLKNVAAVSCSGVPSFALRKLRLIKGKAI